MAAGGWLAGLPGVQEGFVLDFGFARAVFRVLFAVAFLATAGSGASLAAGREGGDLSDGDMDYLIEGID